jgi:amylovoran biosynthesis glycosyltransferase AmsE
MGTAKSSNIGLSLCTCELIFKMDSDDIMFPDRIEKQIAFMKSNKDIVMCGTNIRLFKNDGTCRVFVNDTRHSLKVTWDDLYNKRMSWYVNNPTLCYRKSAIQQVGNYRTNDDRILYIHEDYDLLARVLKKYKVIYNIPDVLLLYRLHTNQLTHELKVESPENVKLRNDIIENANIM